MKKVIIIYILLVSFQSNAGVISVDFSENFVSRGERLAVKIDLNQINALSNLVFAFTFDSSIFTFDKPSFSSDLAIFDVINIDSGLQVEEQLNLLAFNYQSENAISGILNIASFDLIAAQPGIGNFNIINIFSTNVLAGEEFFVGINLRTAASSQVAVSEPETLLLFMLSVTLTFFARRKSNKKVTTQAIG